MVNIKKNTGFKGILAEQQGDSNHFVALFLCLHEKKGCKKAILCFFCPHIFISLVGIVSIVITKQQTRITGDPILAISEGKIWKAKK